MSKVKFFVVIILFSFALILIGNGFYTAFKNAPHNEIICENISIVSLHDNLVTTGKFCLFSGYLDGEMQYMVYIKQKTGGIKLIQIPSDRTTIYEDSESPYLSEFALWSVYPEAENETAENNWKHSPNWEYPIYELHVPSGTVIQEYNLNGM